MRPLICSVLLALLPASALAAPGIPESFHGSVNASAGAEIDALLSSAVVASTTVESGSLYGYAPHLFLIPDPYGNRAGATISFSVGGVAAPQTATFANGAIATLDLILPSTVATSTATSTTSSQAVATTTSSQTSSSAKTLSDESSTPVAKEFSTTLRPRLPRYYDLTGDGRIDLGDLTFLLAHWGLAGKGTPADINGDGIVNLLDFNLLMSHWSL